MRVLPEYPWALLAVWRQVEESFLHMEYVDSIQQKKNVVERMLEMC